MTTGRGATWLVGDLHFGHTMVASIRGFDSVDDHDRAIRTRWTKQVRESDLVYVLGDISAGGRQAEARALAILQELPGRKRLIAGNHDSVSSVHRKLSPHVEEFRSTFENIGDFGRLKVSGRDVLLSHFPYEGDSGETERFVEFRLRDCGLPLIHAHTHSTQQTLGRQMCVSWDAWRRMVGMADVQRWLEQTQRREGSVSPDA